MSNMLGLIELLLVLVAGVGFALYELRSLRRNRTPRDPAGAPPNEAPPD